MNSKIFETLQINFFVGDEVCTLEHTPDFGDLKITGCGHNRSFDLLGPSSEKITAKDMINFLQAVEWMRDRLLILEEKQNESK